MEEIMCVIWDLECIEFDIKYKYVFFDPVGTGHAGAKGEIKSFFGDYRNCTFSDNNCSITIHPVTDKEAKIFKKYIEKQCDVRRSFREAFGVS
jgi:hypothetical protein